MAPPPSAHSHSPDPQLTQQFLSSVLSQRGPSALPYSEDTKRLIRQHLLSLTTTFPSLEPRTATFTHNDGRSVNLLQADGTIPMILHGVTYNIPVVIWLMELYPRHAPCVYLNPTRDMIIKRPHPFVNPSGMVSVPYLQNWVYPSYNLVDLVRNLSVLFGRDPPLYSQRRAPPSPNPNYGSSSSFSSNSRSSSGYAPSPIPPRTYPPSPYGSGGAAGSPARVQSSPEDSPEFYRRNAINTLVEMIHTDVVGLRKTREVEMESLISLQGVLRQREEQLNKGLKEMQGEMEGLEQQLQIILTNEDVLRGWLRENKGKMLGGLGNVEYAFKCVDVVSEQMLECTAADLAIEDTVYTLDRAVHMGTIPFDQYLRSVRAMSREQFFYRAKVVKVREAQLQAEIDNREAQLQAEVDNMAARISHYVSEA